jgi:hypothetical protein
MFKKLALGLIVSSVVGVTAANATCGVNTCCGGNFCDGYQSRGVATLHHQGGMVTSLHGGMMLSYQAPGHALLCGHYVEEGLVEVEK